MSMSNMAKTQYMKQNAGGAPEWRHRSVTTTIEFVLSSHAEHFSMCCDGCNVDAAVLHLELDSVCVIHF